MVQNVRQMGNKSITFRANPITQRLLCDLKRYYQEHTLGPKKLTTTQTILAAIWDAYTAAAAAGHITAPSGKSKSKRLKFEDFGTAST